MYGGVLWEFVLPLREFADGFRLRSLLFGQREEVF